MSRWVVFGLTALISGVMAWGRWISAETMLAAVYFSGLALFLHWLTDELERYDDEA